ncbi:hypothetical protein ABZW18_20435 [Streptomyces sp. NPDC004647]|uniref:hypothetical protein n=1 Tax=Streptomyces sp. NPDC004647 TaxID=3154671 RepID=UPI0033B33C21
MPSEPEKQVDDSEFMDVAKDPAEARALRKALQQIAGGGAGDTLKEMAQDTLSGRIGLRQATETSGYTDALIEKAQPFREQWDAMSEAERQARAVEGERALDEHRREIEEERRAAQRQNSKSGGAHSGKNWSLY